jgi:hypothetical protein
MSPLDVREVMRWLNWRQRCLYLVSLGLMIGCPAWLIFRMFKP